MLLYVLQMNVLWMLLHSFCWEHLTTLADRKYIAAWLHWSLEKFSDNCKCRHQLAFHPVAFHSAFPRAYCWSLHRLQWWKRCFCISRIRLLYLQHVMSSPGCNCYKYIPVGACLIFSLVNCVPSDFTFVIGMEFVLKAWPFSLHGQLLEHLSASHYACKAVLILEIHLALFQAEVYSHLRAV